MRRARRLFLFIIILIVLVVGGTYYLQKTRQLQQAPLVPESLPDNVAAEGKDWVYTQHDGQRPVVSVQAKRMRQIAEPSQYDLEQVELRIFDSNGENYDHVISAFASLDTSAAVLYSDGEVEITLGVPSEGPPPERPVIIRSSGVRFDVNTGKATTDRPASFAFEFGEGRSVGASYDPVLGDLRMHSQAKLRWHGDGSRKTPMEVEAGELVYKEDLSKVYLSPWSRFTRGSLTLEADNSVVSIEQGAIRLVEAENARGADKHQLRRIEYAADHLVLNFTPTGEMERIAGERHAKLVSVSETARTTVTSGQIFLDFAVAETGSTLRTALATDGGTIESAPVPRAGVQLPETRLLRSEVIKMLMRPGGEEIETIETEAPGTVEFIPNRPEHKHRRLDGERLWIRYGANNRISSFRAVNSSTRTDNEPAPPSLTWSKELLATFDEETSEMITLEQSGDFRYEKGTRKAKAGDAVLDLRRDFITLEDTARIWDETGSTAADRILLDQQSEHLVAIGRVSSMSLPEAGESSVGILDQGESLHATAKRMETSDGNANIVYEDNVVLWQGSSRLRADRVDIDKNQGILKARGHLVSRMLDTREKSAPLYTIVRAQELVYTESSRLAHYKGDVHLSRADIQLDSRELRAFFSPINGQPSSSEPGAALERALADGEVSIVQQEQNRTRTGLAEHADYYLGDEKIILRGGQPRLIDSLKGTTQGRQLTYFARDDRLLVDGEESQPAVSRLVRE